MHTPRRIAAASAFGLMLALSGCVSGPARLADSADQLKLNADTLAQNARYQPVGADYPPSYARDALTLAGDAQQLSAAAQDRGAADDQVRDAFVRVTRDYDAVRHGIERSDSDAARSDFVPVTVAYRDLEQKFAQPGSARGGAPETALAYP
jgi:hypothetical protein